MGGNYLPSVTELIDAAWRGRGAAMRGLGLLPADPPDGCAADARQAKACCHAAATVGHSAATSHSDGFRLPEGGQ